MKFRRVQLRLQVSTKLQSIPTAPEKSIGVYVFTEEISQELCVVPLDMLTAVTVWERLTASIHLTSKLTSKSEYANKVTFLFHLLKV